MGAMNGLVPLLLRLTGQGAWSPFFRILSNQGRPSPVFFPPELVEQGLGFALRGTRPGSCPGGPSSRSIRIPSPSSPRA
jgi:hypothetical protein